VGKLNYLTITKLDITYTIRVVSQFLATPWTTHWDAAFLMLRYLKCALGKWLIFKERSYTCRRVFWCRLSWNW